MPDINPNNNFSWRNKLEDLEQLSGETFNKEAAWDKLHDLLQGRKGNSKRHWYWMAAACLLIASAITWLIYPKNNPQLSIFVTTKTPSKKFDNSNSTIDKNKETKNTNNDLSANNKLLAISTRSHPIKRTVIPDIVVSKIRLADTANIQINSITENNMPQTFNIPPTAVIIFPAKKKLKVVHINELGDQVEAFSDMARNTDLHSFQIKLANEEAFVNPATASRTRSITILKVKPF